MTGEELRKIRKSMRMNQDLWGRFMGVTRSAVSDWEMGHKAVPVLVERVANVLEETPELAYRLMPELKTAQEKETEKENV